MQALWIEQYLSSILPRKGFYIAQSGDTPLLLFTHIISTTFLPTIWLTEEEKRNQNYYVLFICILPLRKTVIWLFFIIYLGQKGRHWNLFWGLWFSLSNSIDDGSSGSTAITSTSADFNSRSDLASDPSGRRSTNTFEKLLYNERNNACMFQ